MGCQISTQLFKLAYKYGPKIKLEKKKRLLAQADKRTVSKGGVSTQGPPALWAGVHAVTTLVENKAGLVVTASDTDPMELVVFLPVPSYKVGVPYLLHYQGEGQAGTSSAQEDGTGRPVPLHTHIG